VMIIEKPENRASHAVAFRCPHSKEPLVNGAEALYSSAGGYIYPKIQEIPCLMGDHRILATHYEKFAK
jgi:uncharacterized protein YbaR (Trm112 family)